MTRGWNVSLIDVHSLDRLTVRANLGGIFLFTAQTSVILFFSFHPVHHLLSSAV